MNLQNNLSSIKNNQISDLSTMLNNNNLNIKNFHNLINKNVEFNENIEFIENNLANDNNSKIKLSNFNLKSSLKNNFENEKNIKNKIKIISDNYPQISNIPASNRLNELEDNGNEFFSNKNNINTNKAEDKILIKNLFNEYRLKNTNDKKKIIVNINYIRIFK